MSTHIDAFSINNTKIDLTDDNYNEAYGFADYTQQTEAGTTQRDVIRAGYLAQLSVDITVPGTVKALFDGYSKEPSLTLTLWSDESSSSRSWTCYISSYTAKLKRDTDTATYWDLSITFDDLEGISYD